MITYDVPYGPYAQHKLDLYTPEGPVTRGIIIIHGGGWDAGDKSIMTVRAMKYAEAGILAAAINYRLVVPGASTGTWPRQLADVQLAVRWFKRNASVDGRVAVEGNSAGATLALWLGVLRTINPGDLSAIYPNTPPTVRCVVANSPATDLLRLSTTSISAGVQGVKDMVNYSVTGDGGLVAASPIHSVSAESSPIYISHGRLDGLVPFEQAMLMNNALASFGTDHVLAEHPGGHVWQDLSDAQRIAIQKLEMDWTLGKL